MESSSGRESTGRVPLSGVVRCTVMAMVFPEMSTSMKLSLGWVLQGVNVTRPKKEELAFEKKKKKEDNLVAVLLSAFGDFRVLSKIGVLPRCTCLSFSFVSKADVIGLGMKGRIWLTKVSRVRSSVWKVGGKRPGYNASDSESDELEEDS
ncbi:hypothetical protein D0Y65_049147 [Glycine soja]|uniref:Uncharacterized protein n=1 Tax=Glycine soja TaxID=3848 RepID=A0A445FVP1_GLYSO|nr:hypothetical protein D0Y65_049147 [Glycine soja]RZB52970.1 hypothetical protein D0Y65_049147 [Glycine soja]RZB52971.1 hypothetical protein D0Y65_049147 [Glycine soja]